MSEPIDWNALTPAQRNALIAEEVMGWTSQLCDKSESLIKKIASRYYEHEYLDEVFEEFRRELLNDSGDEIWPATDLLLDMAKWTPDAICLIALKAYGVEVKQET